MTKKQQRQTLRALEEAPEIIKEYGWHQGSYGNKEIGFCALGAVNQAVSEQSPSNGHRIFCEAYAQVRMVVFGTNEFTYEDSLSGWNDSVLTTKRKVLSALRKAAKAYRAQVTA